VSRVARPIGNGERRIEGDGAIGSRTRTSADRRDLLDLTRVAIALGPGEIEVTRNAGISRVTLAIFVARLAGRVLRQPTKTIIRRTPLRFSRPNPTRLPPEVRGFVDEDYLTDREAGGAGYLNSRRTLRSVHGQVRRRSKAHVSIVVPCPQDEMRARIRSICRTEHRTAGPLNQCAFRHGG